MIGEDDDDSGGGNGSDDIYNESMEPVLVLSSDLYSEDKEILVGNSKHSSCPTYTIY